MPLISSKLEPRFPRTLETKMHQCLLYYLWCLCPIEVHQHNKNQNFEKDKDQQTVYRKFKRLVKDIKL